MNMLKVLRKAYCIIYTGLKLTGYTVLVFWPCHSPLSSEIKTKILCLKIYEQKQKSIS